MVFIFITYRISTCSEILKFCGFEVDNMSVYAGLSLPRTFSADGDCVS